MKRLLASHRKVLTWIVLIAFFARVSTPVYAKSAVKLQNFQGTIDVGDDGNGTFTLEGQASHLGEFTAYGEVTFVPGEEQDTLVGEGVAVFTAANGDLLVGVVSWDVAPQEGDFRTTSIHFSWRDSIQLADGTVVSSTGHFADPAQRPPGLVVIAIIAILIGLLVPAVQKVR